MPSAQPDRTFHSYGVNSHVFRPGSKHFIPTGLGMSVNTWSNQSHLYTNAEKTSFESSVPERVNLIRSPSNSINPAS